MIFIDMILPCEIFNNGVIITMYNFILPGGIGLNINDTVHGFKLLRKTHVQEISSEAFLFEHEKSGARLFFLQNEDDNKVFSITFRTPPVDDTGVAHIVEHSTLCGSRKYPLKEPFVELAKGSLNTFLNAMTYPDKTMYPVASRNDKDFQNLMDVYLDAVFYPNMRENPQILMQEGWHYEINDPSEPLKYSGVVYNEMKGALSSPDDLLESRVMASLYPDTTYGYESGGNPLNIPDLTQEQFVAFHSRYYHPSNSYIYLYGDMDIEQKLAYLDREYLSHFDRIPVPSQIERQAPFEGLREMRDEYPISQDEDTTEKTFLALNWLVGGTQNMQEMLALDVLNHALLKTPAAPLRQALVAAHLGRDIDSTYEDAVLQPYFSISVAGSESDRAEKFCRLTHDTLAKLVEQGLDKTLLEASLNLMEFRLREADFGSAPKGLIYGIAAMKTWLYGGEPEHVLAYEKPLKRLKEGLNEGYFEGLIRKYFLDNPHETLVILAPSRTLAAEREDKLRKKLAEKKAALTEQEIRELIAANKALKECQQAPETEEALASIPVLKLSDIRQAAYELPLVEKEIMGTKVLHSPLDTHGIGYMNLYFDASRVPQERLPYLYLLSILLGEVGTSQRSYSDLANLENLHTGGINFDIVAYTRKNEPDSCEPKLRVKAKALTKKLPHLCQLLQEILTQSLFTDEKRIRELIEQEAAGIELSLQRSAHQLVTGRISAYLMPAGRYADQGGLPFYHFLKDFLADFEAKFSELPVIFGEILRQVFNRRGLVMSITLPQADYRSFEAAFAPLRQSLSSLNFPVQRYRWKLVAKNEGLTAASQVQYVAQGANFLKLGHKFTGSMHVLETLLRYDYFWTKIRVQGGAYGAFTSFNRNGMMSFGSYRDPHLKQTLKVFSETVDYMKNFDASDREMTKAIIGTMSNVDTPLTPQMKGDLAATYWLRGITYLDRQQTRLEILSTRQADIRALAKTVEDCMKQKVLCVFGGEEKIKENKEVFGKVIPAL